jgi:RimJ/RimL family protein N-acetyltransferase
VPKLIVDVVAAGSVAAGPQPTIVIDDELVLRPFDDGDVSTVVAAFAVPDIQHFHFRSLDDDEARQWIDETRRGWRDERAATWAIEQRADAQVLGRVTIYLRLPDGAGEVSYWVLPAGRRRGVATRACRTATAWAHGIGIHRVELQHSTANDASRRVAVAAGFVFEGVQREAARLADGWHDMAIHAHLSTD